MMRRLARAFFAIGFLACPVARADPLEAVRAERWKDLRQAIFEDWPVEDGAGEIFLETPDRALDGARVPVTIRLRDPSRAKSLYLIIDENPMPLAARVGFGPGGDPKSLGLEVRIDRYTYVHAVAETREGALYEVRRFVKASGGCSGPPLADEAAAGVAIGQMTLSLGTEAMPAPEIRLAIKHPNCTGMQIDPTTKGYLPARFLQTMEVSHDGESVLRLESGISLAADPTISFRLEGKLEGKLAVVARDSDDMVFERTFDLDRHGS